MNTLLALAVLLAQANPPALAAGSAAPDFDLPGVDGKRYALKDFASSKVLLVLFNTVHCPTSQKYEERIGRLVGDYRDKGVGVAVISPSDPLAVRPDELGYTDLDDSFESMKLRAKDRKYNYPFLYDGETQAASRAYGPAATPHAFLFDSERKLRYAGRIDDNDAPERVKSHDLRNAIEALLQGRDVPVAQTRPRGCSTKWSTKRDSVKTYLEKIAKEPVAVEEGAVDAVTSLLRNDSGKARVLLLWTEPDGRALADFAQMYHWYRRRKVEFIAVALAGADRREKVEAALRKECASHRNLLVSPEAAEGLAAPPAIMVLSPSGEVVFKQKGGIDALEARRAVQSQLKED